MPYAIDELQAFRKKNERISDQELFDLLLEIDRELVQEEVPVSRRHLEGIQRLQSRLDTIVTSVDPLWTKICGFFKQLYPLKDHVLLPMHRGVFYFQGVIYELSTGFIVGKFNIDILKFIKGISPIKAIQLKASDDFRVYIDQCCDLLDVFFGIDELKSDNSFSKDSRNLIFSGKAHLNSMTETLLSTTDDRDASMSNALLGTEMFLKGGLSYKGVSLKKLKKLSHKVDDIVQEFGKMFPQSDITGLVKAAANIPKDVNSRYKMNNYAKCVLGHAAMSAQFCAGEVIRMLTGQNARNGLRVDGNSSKISRAYP